MSKLTDSTNLAQVVASDHGHEVRDEKGGTAQDIEDMKRMGKEQLFKVLILKALYMEPPENNVDLNPVQRNFGFLSIFGFAMILMNTWQALLGSVLFMAPMFQLLVTRPLGSRRHCSHSVGLLPLAWVTEERQG